MHAGTQGAATSRSSVGALHPPSLARGDAGEVTLGPTRIVFVLPDLQLHQVLALSQDLHGVLHGTVVQTDVVDGQQLVARLQGARPAGPGWGMGRRLARADGACPRPVPHASLPVCHAALLDVRDDQGLPSLPAGRCRENGHDSDLRGPRVGRAKGPRAGDPGAGSHALLYCFLALTVSPAHSGPQFPFCKVRVTPAAQGKW